MKAGFVKKKLKVITVDDSPLVAQRMESMMREIEEVEFLGNVYKFSTAHYLIGQERPDVVILDINLNERIPEDNGISLLAQLRKKYKDMKIIILTNQTSDVYQKICSELGADYFFDKSNEFGKIPEVIQRMCRSAN